MVVLWVTILSLVSILPCAQYRAEWVGQIAHGDRRPAEHCALIIWDGDRVVRSFDVENGTLGVRLDIQADTLFSLIAVLECRGCQPIGLPWPRVGERLVDIGSLALMPVDDSCFLVRNPGVTDAPRSIEIALDEGVQSRLLMSLTVRPFFNQTDGMERNHIILLPRPVPLDALPAIRLMEAGIVVDQVTGYMSPATFAHHAGPWLAQGESRSELDSVRDAFARPLDRVDCIYNPMALDRIPRDDAAAILYEAWSIDDIRFSEMKSYFGANAIGIASRREERVRIVFQDVLRRRLAELMAVDTAVIDVASTLEALADVLVLSEVMEDGQDCSPAICNAITSRVADGMRATAPVLLQRSRRYLDRKSLHGIAFGLLLDDDIQREVTGAVRLQREGSYEWTKNRVVGLLAAGRDEDAHEIASWLVQNVYSWEPRLLLLQATVEADRAWRSSPNRFDVSKTGPIARSRAAIRSWMDTCHARQAAEEEPLATVCRQLEGLLADG